MQTTRKAIYDALLHTDLKSTASQWGVPTASILTACIEHHIPIPVKHDHAEPLGDNPDESVTLVVRKAADVILTNSTRSLLPEVRASYVALKRSATSANGLLRQRLADGIRIEASKSTLTRATLITNTIIKECKRRGWDVSYKDNVNHISYLGGSTSFVVREKLRYITVKRHSYNYRELEPTSVLQCRFGPAEYKETCDTRTHALEEKLAKLMDRIEGELFKSALRRQEDQRNETYRSCVSSIEWLIRDAQKADTKCLEALDNAVAAFTQAEQFRKLATAIEEQPLDPAQRQWVEWVKVQANRIDPAHHIGNIETAVPTSPLEYVQAGLQEDTRQKLIKLGHDPDKLIQVLIKRERSVSRITMNYKRTT